MLAQLTGVKWRLMTPQHLWFFTQESMRRLASGLGLTVEHVDHPWKIVPASLIAFQLRRMLGLRSASIASASPSAFPSTCSTPCASCCESQSQIRCGCLVAGRVSRPVRKLAAPSDANFGSRDTSNFMILVGFDLVLNERGNNDRNFKSIALEEHRRGCGIPGCAVTRKDRMQLVSRGAVRGHPRL
jgi:hypothetical protein